MVALPAAVLFVSACTPSGPAGPSLAVDKSVYAPGRRSPSPSRRRRVCRTNAWVGIIPSNVPHGDEAQNDSYDLTYQYLNGMTSGMLVFSAPTVPGSYDFRMHDTDSNGKEIASVTFTVQ